MQLARSYGANEDVVFAGVLLHDIGKLQELDYEPGGAIVYERRQSRRPRRPRPDHRAPAITGISGFPDDLRAQIEHLIVSHHGRREHGSPVEPRTIEAFIVAMVDELDTRIHQVRNAIAEDVGSDEFTAWHKRLGRVLYKGAALCAVTIDRARVRATARPRRRQTPAPTPPQSAD